MPLHALRQTVLFDAAWRNTCTEYVQRLKTWMAACLDTYGCPEDTFSDASAHQYAFPANLDEKKWYAWLYAREDRGTGGSDTDEDVGASVSSVAATCVTDVADVAHVAGVAGAADAADMTGAADMTSAENESGIEDVAYVYAGKDAEGAPAAAPSTSTAADADITDMGTANMGTETDMIHSTGVAEVAHVSTDLDASTDSNTDADADESNFDAQEHPAPRAAKRNKHTRSIPSITTPPTCYTELAGHLPFLSVLLKLDHVRAARVAARHDAVSPRYVRFPIRCPIA